MRARATSGRLLLATTVLAACIGAAAGVGALRAQPARAHGTQGTLAVEVAPGSAPLQLVVRARLTYANDAEPVSSADVTLEARGPDGQMVAPMSLDPAGNGTYRTTLTVPSPGAWELTTTAADPEARATTSVDVVAPASTTAAPNSTPPTSMSSRSAETGQGGSSLMAPLVGAALFLAAVVTGLAIAARRRRSQGSRSSTSDQP